MAKTDKKDRFPSPANVQVTKEGEVKAHDPKGPVLSPKVDGKKQDLLQVHYSGENHVILVNGVHHLQKGTNHVPKSVFDESAKHPNVQALMKSGKITILKKGEKEPEPAEDESLTEDSDAEGSESEDGE